MHSLPRPLAPVVLPVESRTAEYSTGRATARGSDRGPRDRTKWPGGQRSGAGDAGAAYEPDGPSDHDTRVQVVSAPAGPPNRSVPRASPAMTARAVAPFNCSPATSA